MARQPSLARRAEVLLGSAVVATAPLAGGDVATATRLRTSAGTSVLMKTLHQAPPRMFEHEAAGLRWLGEVDGGVAVPGVLGVDDACLLLEWVEPGKAGPEAAEAFGRALAVTHAAGAPSFGAEHDGFVGRLPLPNRPADTWAEFYVVRRLLPYLKLARDRGAVTDAEAAVVEGVAGRIGELVPDGPPARLHGDLWNGNVLWSTEGRVLVVDPAAYGGHREVDLAMLALFGLPQLPRVMEAYRAAAADLDGVAPLDDELEDRLGVHQLFPLLVHACLFGGGYGARAARTAARYA